VPHFKCAACKTRLYSAAHSADLVGDLCPSCGSLLEPVAHPAEVLGFRSIKPRDSAADRVDDLTVRREVILSQARLDAGRWLDDGGSFRAEALPLPRLEIER
jgi:hypothetical protein